MGNRRYRSHGMGFFIIAAILLIGSLTAWATAPTLFRAADQRRSDILVIDSLKQFGALERPAVPFYHDQHTQALTEQDKDCLACHPMKDEQLSLKFKRTDDLDKQSVMDLYHDNCIACHQQLRKANVKSGPVTCGECHTADAATDSNRQAMQLNKSLHFRHTRALADKCDQCHHQFNEETQTLVHVKGEEGACLYCHKSQTEENRISYRLAAHTQCIACHRGKITQKIEAGPVECAGCHNPGNQIATVSDVPRMKRNQPDAVLIKTDPAGETGLAAQGGMRPVAFDHRAHESYNDSCRVCHHADLGSCVGCHTRKGTADGIGITLSQAMHHNKADTSCVGCHRSVQSNTQCIGCHHAMAAQPAQATEPSCGVCHTPRAENETDSQGGAMDDKALAEKLLAGRPATAPPVATDQNPETVTINQLVDQYEAVNKPHRKIVLALAQGMADNTLAQRFHTDSTTLCRGCHHNAPGSLSPSPCAGCHSRTSDVLNLTRPGLMAAYHQQCIKCHAYMDIDKPASRQCTACHAQRTLKSANR